MNGFGERSRSWTGDSFTTPSEVTYSSGSAGSGSREGSWKDLGTSMSAISFGLAATAILISMFLVMAIFEHLIKPRASFLRPRSSTQGSSSEIEIGQERAQTQSHEKHQNSLAVGAQYRYDDLPVLMPGQQYPTYIAQPAPLPCPREGIQWPPHSPHSSLL